MKSLIPVFTDAAGQLSSTRLAFLAWTVGVMVVWGYQSVKVGQLVAVPESVTMILGILMTGKVTQRFGEKSQQARKRGK